jgi:hypothetical protein
MVQRSTKVLLVAGVLAGAAAAQVDLTGNWGPVFHEDSGERGPGPPLADFAGLPINGAARQWALSWDPGRLALEEHQCQVHTAAYIYRGPLQVRIWEEKDPETQELIALRQYISTYEQHRTIYMDGRPHPPEWAPHTWMGFSTGVWDGDVLTVTTTHIKQGWHRRNGLPSSDKITLVEHYIRHGDSMTHVTVVTDPVYLSEPMVKSQDFNKNPRVGANWLWPCEYVVEDATKPRDAVPHFLPGENPYAAEYASRRKIPVEAALGGAETMYPEYMRKLAAAPRPVSPAK